MKNSMAFYLIGKLFKSKKINLDKVKHMVWRGKVVKIMKSLLNQ